MLAWYEAGKFPFDKLLSLYPLNAITQAEEDMKAGRTVKPVLIP
jgi:aryl-alcohol dehydrogenase